jgi:putative ABC transport system permease protein
MLNRDSYEIVGVLEKGVDFLARDVQLWTPYRIAQSDFEDRHSHFLNVLARLLPHVSREQAQREMETIADRIRLEHPDEMEGRGVNVVQLRDELIGNVRPTLVVLLGAVLLMMLIAVVNVASLLLVKAIGRRREIAVRSALGADRGRLIRQSLTESLVLTTTGGAIGVAIAAAGTDTMIALLPRNIPRASEVGIDLGVLVFAVGLSLATGVAVGLFPALQSANVRISGTLAAAGRWASGGERTRLRQALVVAELALAMTLLIGAGLLARTLWQLMSVDPGFTADRTLAASFRLPRSDYPDITRVSAFHDELLDDIRAMPQISSAGLTRFLPLNDGPWTFSLEFEDLQSVRGEGDRRSYAYNPISTDYFRAAGIQLLHGRDISTADDSDAPPVLIINRAMKQLFWPDTDALGTRVRFSIDTVANRWREIVGIVENVHHDGLDRAARPVLYGPYQQAFPVLLDRMRLVARTTSDPLLIAPQVRSIVSRIDPNIAVFDIRTVEQLLASSISQPRFSMWLLISLSCIATLLAIVGIYGVTSYTVRCRLPELGLRIALGAQSKTVALTVFAQGMALATLGIGLGTVGALMCTRVLESLLFGIGPTDPLTYLGLAVGLATTAAAACYLPARKAASVDPLTVMRTE